jgi:RNA polymerase sigma factor (sigma-70 family)
LLPIGRAAVLHLPARCIPPAVNEEADMALRQSPESNQPSEPDFQELLRLALKGDHGQRNRAIDELIDLFGGDLARMARRRGSSRHAAENLVMQVLARLATLDEVPVLAAGNERRHLFNFLRRMLRQAASEHSRSEQKHARLRDEQIQKDYLAHQAARHPADPSQDAVRKEEADNLHKLIEGHGDNGALARTHFLDGAPIHEAAEKHGITPRAAYQRLYRFYDQARAQLPREMVIAAITEHLRALRRRLQGSAPAAAAVIASIEELFYTHQSNAQLVQELLDRLIALLRQRAPVTADQLAEVHARAVELAAP